MYSFLLCFYISGFVLTAATSQHGSNCSFRCLLPTKNNIVPCNITNGSLCDVQCKNNCPWCKLQTGSCVHQLCHDDNCSSHCMVDSKTAGCENDEATASSKAVGVWIYVGFGSVTLFIIGLLVLTSAVVLKRHEMNVRRQAMILSYPDGEEDPEISRKDRKSEITNVKTRAASAFKDTRLRRMSSRSKISTRIQIKDLLTRVLMMDAKYLNDEFANLKKGVAKECNVAMERKNISKNFFEGVYPYDENRVKIREKDMWRNGITNLSFDGFSLKTSENGDSSDYINASFIKGYKNGTSYIAAQGPNEVTASDFWTMIWEQECQIVVMLYVPSDNAIEHKKQYWPGPGLATTYGEIIVKTKATNTFAHIVVKKFTLKKDGNERALTHLQLTTWPDYSNPSSYIDFIDFHQKYQSVLRISKDTPTVVVHCTDGVGRTGVFVAFDMLVSEGKETSSVDVFQCVQMLRLQRADMVKSCSQYEILYRTLTHMLSLHCQTIPKSAFKDYHKELKRMKQGTNKMGELYEKCKESLLLDVTEIVTFDWAQERHAKDRPTSDIPDFICRPSLPNNAYINAVNIDTYKRQAALIATQTPVLTTVHDFLELVVHQECGTILMLNKVDKHDTSTGYYWPKSKEYLTIGGMTVSIVDEKRDSNCSIIRKLKLEGKIGGLLGTLFFVNMVQYEGWKALPNIPDVKSLLSLVATCKRLVKDSGDKRLLVQCLNGCDQSGLFCALYNIVERLDLENGISVISIIRKIKARRPFALYSMDQFEMCFNAADVYLSEIGTEFTWGQ